MRIIDAQVHIWASGTPTGDHRQVSSFSAHDLLAEMAEAGVDGAVIHPPVSWDPDANALAEAATAAHPDRFAVLGQVPLDAPEASHALLQGWRNRPGQCGLRYPLIRADQKDWPFDGTLDWLWPSAEQAGLPIGLAAARFLPVVGRIAERHPALKLHVDHMGVLQGKVGSSAFDHLPDLLALARLPNVAVKLSAVPAYATDAFPFRSLHDPLRRIVDAFGPRRCFWGTDITRMPCSWSRCVELFTEQLPWLQGEDLAWVMGRAVCEWLDWPLPAAEADQ